jgi:hypothetical protein
VQQAYSWPAEFYEFGGYNGYDLLCSATGVRQRDPLGPLLFAPGLQDPIAELISLCPTVNILVCLDDMYLLGPRADVGVCIYMIAFTASSFKWLHTSVKCGIRLIPQVLKNLQSVWE